jgi:hypothetical protein
VPPMTLCTSTLTLGMGSAIAAVGRAVAMGNTEAGITTLRRRPFISRSLCPADEFEVLLLGIPRLVRRPMLPSGVVME